MSETIVKHIVLLKVNAECSKEEEAAMVEEAKLLKEKVTGITNFSMCKAAEPNSFFEGFGWPGMTKGFDWAFIFDIEGKDHLPTYYSSPFHAEHASHHPNVFKDSEMIIFTCEWPKKPWHAGGVEHVLLMSAPSGEITPEQEKHFIESVQMAMEIPGVLQVDVGKAYEPNEPYEGFGWPGMTKGYKYAFVVNIDDKANLEGYFKSPFHKKYADENKACFEGISMLILDYEKVSF